MCVCVCVCGLCWLGALSIQYYWYFCSQSWFLRRQHFSKRTCGLSTKGGNQRRRNVNWDKGLKPSSSTNIRTGNNPRLQNWMDDSFGRIGVVALYRVDESTPRNSPLFVLGESEVLVPYVILHVTVQFQVIHGTPWQRFESPAVTFTWYVSKYNAYNASRHILKKK